jgi:hypothetical protein
MSESIDRILREMREASALEAAEAQAAADAAVNEDTRRDVHAILTRDRPPARFKAPEDWTVEDILEHRRTEQAPETPAYREYVRRVNEAAGLARPDGDALPVEDMTANDHLRQIRRR